jgi:hypothetical protein
MVDTMGSVERIPAFRNRLIVADRAPASLFVEISDPTEAVPLRIR